MDISEAVATRRSVRAFLDRPVPFDTVKRVMEQARMAPSGCNFQPWEAVVLTGAGRVFGAGQDIDGAQRHVPQVANWRGDNIEPRRQWRVARFGGRGSHASI